MTVSTLAFVIVAAASIWLIAVALLMALRPDYALHLFSRMASSLEASNWRLNLTEQALRIIAGAALIIRASDSKLPLLFQLFGWALLVSSIIILVSPMRVHAAYGAWCLKWLSARLIRILSPVPAAMGAAIIYAGA